MKKFRLLYATGAALALVLVISACKSTPPVASEPVAETAPAVTEPVAAAVVAPAVKPVDDSLTALRDKMEALRGEGIKYGLDKYKTDDWAKAEVVRATGLGAYGTDYDLAQKSFEDAISRYESIRKDSFASISADLEAQIIEARKEAVRVGADTYYPDQFAAADQAADVALKFKASDDYAGAYDNAQIALMRFKTLQLGMRAVELKTKIEKNEFAQYAQEDYDKAEAKYTEAANTYGTADPAAYEAMASAVTLYESVNNAGFKVLAEVLSPKVDDMRALSLSIKAEKAAKTEYAESEAAYNAAHNYAKDGKWESAYNAGNDALDAFSDLYQNVLLRRNAADAAISAAKDKQAASSELARKADERLPLPEDATGYSEEVPVLDEAAPVVNEVAPAADEPDAAVEGTK